MPYIKQENRDKFYHALRELSQNITCSGDLNYVITSLIHKELFEKGLNYEHINSMIGVLECAKLELYRKIAAPYEDVKIKENGNVSNLDM